MKISVFFTSILCFSMCYADGLLDQRSDSGIFGPKYSVILDQIAQLHLEYGDITEMVDYGKSVKGKPLRMLIIMKKNKFALERPALIMTGSTHGNEYLNIEDRLPQSFLKASERNSNVSQFLNQGGALVLVPILNPDGYDSRNRENANGVDLNRDWDVPPAGFKGFKQTETRLLAEKLQELTLPPYNLRYRISVDYHCCIGALLYPWSYTQKNMPEPDESQHVAIGEIANKHMEIEYGTTGKILGYYPVGTTKDYYYSKYKTLAFTFEGRYKKEHLNFDKHVSWWDEMLGAFSQTTTMPLFSAIQKRTTPFPKIAD